MSGESMKKTPKQKEAELLARIEKAKQDLVKLQSKRKAEVGKLACQQGLDAFDDTVLNTAFAKLANELSHENQ